MRHGATQRRHRGRGHTGHQNNNNNNNGRRGPNRMQVFDSNGPEVRIRGTAHQVFEKYLALAKDAASAGDRVLAESYMQHAEHYQRTINIWDEEARANGYSSSVQSNPQPDEPIADATVTPHGQSDDLSLPSSIIGVLPQTLSQESQDLRTSEMAS